MSIPTTFQFLKLTNQRILKTFTNNPMLANSCTGLIIFTSGDICSQYFKNRSTDIDYRRALQTGTLGIFMNGIMLHYWYRSLDYMFGTSMNRYAGVILKVAMDQLVYAPFSIGVFFSVASIGKGGDLNTICERFKQKSQESFMETWAADCMVWPLVNFLNFRFIPIHLRPTFVGFAQLMWQTYMSTIGHRECKPLPEIISLPSPNFTPSVVAFN